MMKALLASLATAAVLVGAAWAGNVTPAQLKALSKRVTKLEQANTALAGRVSSLEAAGSALADRVTGVESAGTSAAARVTSLEACVRAYRYESAGRFGNPPGAGYVFRQNGADQLETAIDFTGPKDATQFYLVTAPKPC